MQSSVQTLTWALGESNLHVLLLLPHVALDVLVFSIRSIYDFVNDRYQEPVASKKHLQCELNLLGTCRC